MTHSDRSPRIAVLVPCHNEALTVGKVVRDFRRELPEAVVYVFDNCSTDETAALAREAGAVVRKEPRKGKGFVVDRMLREVVADAYIMVDGDDTYPAERARDLLAPLLAGDADMVVGTRLSQFGDGSFRPLHVFGNKLVRSLVNWVGNVQLTDIMSGYRAFNRRAVEQLPALSAGFEVETDLTIQMVYYRLKVLELPVAYGERPEGSASKLRTFHDGSRVLWKIFTLLRSTKPLTFFGAISLLLLMLGLLAGVPPILDYLTRPDHFVEHVPLAVLATGLVLLSAGCLFVGVILHAFNWRLLELHNVLTRMPAQLTASSEHHLQRAPEVGVRVVDYPERTAAKSRD
jgi:glycosyltransferase involved in cell wall biosynthesis